MHWTRFYQRLEPYVWLIVLLLAFLGAATVATVHRIRRSLALAPPLPLDSTEEAVRARMDVSALLAARELRNVVVHVRPDGAHWVAAREPLASRMKAPPANP
jgi:hypothetical protein